MSAQALADLGARIEDAAYRWEKRNRRPLPPSPRSLISHVDIILDHGRVVRRPPFSFYAFTPSAHDFDGVVTLERLELVDGDGHRTNIWTQSPLHLWKDDTIELTITWSHA